MPGFFVACGRLRMTIPQFGLLGPKLGHYQSAGVGQFQPTPPPVELGGRLFGHPS